MELKKIARLICMFLVTAILAGLVEPALILPEAHAAESRPELTVGKTVYAPVIDGKLDESVWTVNRPLPVQAGEGVFQDARFGVLWDNSYLYVGVKADDTTLINNQSAGYWFDQDNINIFLDPALHRSGPFVSGDMQLGFVYRPDSLTPEFHFGAALNNHSGKDEKKILRAIRQTASGWNLEIAVPWDMLGIDPVVTKQLGINIGVTDRYDDGAAGAVQTRNSYWSAFGSATFWNDTTGYGTLNLSDAPAAGTVSNVLLEEDFDQVPAGQLPFGWISDVNDGSPAFSVVTDTYGNGRMTYNGSASGKQGRAIAPVQGDNYTIEADVRFENVVDSARWASLMFRVPSEGRVPYNQMAVRQNGAYEFAYRNTSGGWQVPYKGNWSQSLALNGDYTLKLRVYGNNVKEYIKAKNAPDFTQLLDVDISGSNAAYLNEKGKIGLQVDQSKVSFDNLKVTRITAERLDLSVPSSVEALTGALTVTGTVYYSDGIVQSPLPGKLKLYSSDEHVLKVIGNQAYPVGAGTAELKLVYDNLELSRTISVTPSATGAQATAIRHADGYVLADAGTPLNLHDVVLSADFTDFSTKEIRGDAAVWTAAGSGITVTGGTVTAAGKGVYPLTVKKDSATASVLLVVKNPGDSEYVLYEENFDGIADGVMPEGWSRKEGTTASKAAVQQGAFVLDALASPDNPSRVLLPEYLGLFGSYKIEADATHLAAGDSARWNSIMYRIQNNDYPYYQMAVRQGATATNGVEFAERTPANAWNVMEKGSYTEAISSSKLYHYTVKAKDNRVQEFINDKLIVDTDVASAYTKGRIGIQANGSKMKLDNVRVTLQLDPLPPMAADKFAKVESPDTGIALAPSVVTEITGADQLAALAAPNLPATVILHVGPGLRVTDPTGAQDLGGLQPILDSFRYKMIPAFYVHDAQAAAELTDYLEANSIEDSFIMADRAHQDLVKDARQRYKKTQGVIDFRAESGLSDDALMDIRKETTRSGAKIALLPQSFITRERTAYLQLRAIVVWGAAAADTAAPALPMHRLITAGVNGIVTASPALAYDAYKVYSHGKTLIRKPYIIGHRGLPALSPENTIESNKLALDYGADFIENDIYLTKDGYLVILHDGSLERTTNGTGNVTQYTLEELKQLNANKSYPVGYDYVQIPAFKEQIDLVKERNSMLMAEIKQTDTNAVVDAYVQLIKDTDSESYIDSMSFSAERLAYLSQIMPDMPTGLLVGNISSNESNPTKSVRDALAQVQGLNATFDVGYTGIGRNFLEAAQHRGLIVSPWTINSKTDLMNLFKLGVFAVTTDYAHWAADWAASIKPEQESYLMNLNDRVNLSALTTAYKGTQTAVTPELVWLDGQEHIAANGAEVTALTPGTAHVLLRYTAPLDDGSTYDLYSVPVTIEVAGTPAPSTLQVTPAAFQMEAGANQSVTSVTYTWGDTVRDVTANAVFTVRDNTVASVSGGVITGLKAGSTVLDVVYGQTHAEAVITVTAKSGGEEPNQPVEPEEPGDSGQPSTSPAAPAQPGNILEARDGKVEAADLEKAFQSHRQVEVKLDGSALAIPAAGLQKATQQPGSQLVITGESAVYSLPLQVLKLDELAQQLNTTVDNLTLRMSIRKLNESEAAGLAQVVAETGSRQIAEPLDFELQAVAPDGHAVQISFGSAYVSREMAVHKIIDPRKTTAAWYDSQSGELRFVPSVFTVKNGESVVEIKRTGNSIYTVVENDFLFADMTNHWAKNDVELLANKLIVQGTEGGRFEGDRTVTRAEFAALLVRGLGLSPAAAGNTFKDVASGAWYARDVATAVAAGLINGYGDGTFRPEQVITREELAAMSMRALAYAGTVKSSKADLSVLNGYKDADRIVWARDEVAAAITLGLMNGTSRDTLSTGDTATRAESAAMLKRLLIQARFINE